MKNILTVGSINMDLVVNADKFPRPGETINGYKFSEIPGGKGANQAIAAKRMGANVKMIGAVGSDIYGNILLENLKKDGIDCCGISTKECCSGIAVITVADAENQIIVVSGANGVITTDDIQNASVLFKWADIVLFQLEIPQEIVLTAARLAKENHAKVLLNCAPYQEISTELLSLTDILVANQTEATLLTGIELKTSENYKEAIQLLMDKGIERIVITLGNKGCIYNDGHNILRCNAYKVQAVDTTAAGDCFIGALGACCDDEISFSDTVSFASAASAISVTRAGASTSIPMHNEVLEFLKKETSNERI